MAKQIQAGDMVVGVRGDASKLKPDLTKATNVINSWGAKTNKSLAGIEKGVARIGKSWSKLNKTLLAGFQSYGLIRTAKDIISCIRGTRES